MTPQNSDCTRIQTEIEEMTASERQLAQIQGEVFEHVCACPTCQQVLDDLAELDVQLGQWEAPEATGNLTVSVMAGIAQAERDQRCQSFDLRHLLVRVVTYRVQIPAGIAALLFLGLIISLCFNMTRDSLQTEPIALSNPKPTHSTVPVHQVFNRGYDDIQTYMANPELASSPLIIIMGAPPTLPSEGLFVPEQAVNRANSL